MSYSVRLLKPLTPKDHSALRTLADARAYLLTLPADEANRLAWQYAAKLIMQAADDPSGPNIAAVTRQLEQALFVGYRLDMSGDATSAAKTRRSSSRSDSSTRVTTKSGRDNSH
jgi:hypothetical protein